MKFITAVVMLTLAVASNASVVSLGLGGIAPWGAASTAIHAPNVWGAGLWGAPAVWGANAWGHGGWAGPAAVVATHAAAPAAVVAAPLGHASSYVAANRGSVHVAPLNGHIQSVNSVNVAPAPGTW